MKLSALEQQVVANLHNLPLNKQQVILELSAFLIHKQQAKKNAHHKQTFTAYLDRDLKISIQF